VFRTLWDIGVVEERGVLGNGDRGAVGNGGQRRGGRNFIPFYSDPLSIRAAGADGFGKESDVWT
jgi:hypothetical protein